jgi:hypothetical protein
MNVGDVLRTAEDFVALPVGSRIRGNRTWTKQEDGRWHRDGSTMVRENGWRLNHLRVDFIPSRFAVGDPLMTMNDFLEVPIGTVIVATNNRSVRYTKIAEDRWDYNGTTHSTADGSFTYNGYNIIAEMPEGTSRARRATLDSVKWNFRTIAMSAAISNGIPQDPVKRVLSALNADLTDFPLGKGVPVLSNEAPSLPNGSLVFTGSPRRWNNFGMFAIKDGAFTHVLGPRTYMDSTVTVAQIAGEEVVADWFTGEGTDEDETAIKLFKARAWRLGEKAKAENRWCGEYERAMERAGITADSLIGVDLPPAAGDQVTPEGAAALPEGSILVWQHTHGLALFVRSARNNAAGTTRLAGYSDNGRNLGHYQDSMFIGWIEGEGTDIRMPRHVTMPQIDRIAPIGTRVKIANDTYVKARDEQWTNAPANPTGIPETGRWRPQSFSTTDMTYITRILDLL